MQLVLDLVADIKCPVGLNKRRWRKVIPSDVDTWVRYCNQGLSLRTIAHLVDRDHSLIRKWVKLAGVSEKLIKHNEHESQIRKTPSPYVPHKERQLKHTSITKCIYNRMYAAAGRANKYDLLFDLDFEYLCNLYKAQDGKCAVTGLPMFVAIKGKTRTHPYSLSLDKVIPQRGYVKGNVRFVCWAVNMALSDWGEEVFATIATAYLEALNNGG